MTDWRPQAAHTAVAAIEPKLRALFGDSEKQWRRFRSRLATESERLFALAHSLYGWRWDFAWQYEAFLVSAATAAAGRSKWLRRKDKRADHSWMTSPETLWGQCYVDRFAKDFEGLAEATPHLEDLGLTHLHLMPPYLTPPLNSDGGYAVSDYRRFRPELGSEKDFRKTIRRLDDSGIGVILDFVANHTADDHPWAEAAKRGLGGFRDYYLIFDDRVEPDRYAGHLREIFPDRGGDAFTWRSDIEGPNGGAWVWTTFHEFQWDLDYRNPGVFTAMLGELLYLVNLGAAVIRMDATPFLWKSPGTDCENQPEAHTLLQLFNGLVGLVAPSVRLLSEAVVHPDNVAAFVRADECHLGYNPLVMSSMWEALASGDTRLLQAALQRQRSRPEGCQWVTYLRCHDDIGWGFADEDALAIGLDPSQHRAYLNSFYSGEFAGSFSTGRRFQDNPRTGDSRISGRMASLAGLESALEIGGDAVDAAVARILMLNAVMLTSVGIPLIYLGDEIAQLNDESYELDERLAGDNRWMHRGKFPKARLKSAKAGSGPEGAVYSGMSRLLEIRKRHSAFAGSLPHLLDTGDARLLAFQRRSGPDIVTVVANFSSETVDSSLELDGSWHEAWSGAEYTGEVGAIDPYGFLLLTQSASDS